MFSFTKQEKAVVFFFVLTALCGTTLQYALKKYPSLMDTVNFIERDLISAKIDLNTASIEELMSIPYIGEYTATNIVEYRLRHGLFTSVEDVKRVKGIRDKNYGRFYPYLTVSRPL